jgi:MFS family permease
MKWQFGSHDINFLIIHGALHRLAWGGSSTFIGVYLYQQGVSLAGVFLSYTGILALRFAFRSLLPTLVAMIGMRHTLIFATFLQAVQYPMLALVHGVGLALALFCAASALGAAFYFTCYHTFFSALGDEQRRGMQIGIRQIMMSAAAVLGPALGGAALALFGPWAAFGAAAIVELGAMVPLFALSEVDPGPMAPTDSFAAFKTGALLLATDGWISNAAVLAWNIIMFRSLSEHFDVFGGALAAAALVGALFGAVLGRFIDLGHARKALWFNAAVYGLNLVIKAVCGENPAIVVTVTIVTSMLTGFYIPALMTAFYNDAKRSRSPFRYQIASEGAWDVGGLLVTVIAAALCAAGAPLQVALVLALVMVPIQAALLHKAY